MSVLGDNLSALLEMEGITQAEFADSIGVSRETANRWVSGDIASIRDKNIEKIRSRYRLSIDDLRSETNGLHAKLRKRNHSSSPPNGSRPTSAGAPAYLPMMRLGSVHAGEPIEEIPDDAVVMVPAHVKEAHPDAFVYKVRGDCMDRVVPDGYDVVADPSISPTRGSIVIAEITPGEALMRRWFKGTDTLMLCADSHSYHEDIVLRDEDSEVFVRVVVVWSQKEIEG